MNLKGREKDFDFFFFFFHSLIYNVNGCQQPGLGQVGARNLQLHLGLPWEWQGPKRLVIEQSAWSEVEHLGIEQVPIRNACPALKTFTIGIMICSLRRLFWGPHNVIIQNCIIKPCYGEKNYRSEMLTVVFNRQDSLVVDTWASHRIIKLHPAGEPWTWHTLSS